MTDTIDTEALDRTDMARLAGGHDAALNDIMERHASAVFRFLARMLGNEDDANDLAQETFVRVHRAARSYKPAHTFRVWLFAIAANLARNHLRWRSRHPNVSLDAGAETDGQTLADVLPSPLPTPGQSAAAAERAEAVRRAVQSLPHDLREAVVLCEWEDMTLAQAAAALETTPKAVESRLYRARNLLRGHLKPWL